MREEIVRNSESRIENIQKGFGASNEIQYSPLSVLRYFITSRKQSAKDWHSCKTRRRQHFNTEFVHFFCQSNFSIPYSRPLFGIGTAVHFCSG